MLCPRGFELSPSLICLDFKHRLIRSVFRSHETDLSSCVYFLFHIMNSCTERFDGLMAMVRIVAGISPYPTTSQLIPGIF